MKNLMKTYTTSEATSYLGISRRTFEKFKFPHYTERRKAKNGKMYEMSIYTQATLEDAARALNLSTIQEKIIDKESAEKSIDFAIKNLKAALREDLIIQIKNCSPTFFEHLVIELLVKMGYGGTLQDAGKAVGKSRDGGIDGIIKEDRLGLDVIYLQAKRWENVVGRPEIQKFAGALQGQRARKGVFITTSDFTKEAREYVLMIDSKVILIDGEELAELMIDYNVGVSNATIYEIKRIDSDYFLEE